MAFPGCKPEQGSLTHGLDQGGVIAAAIPTRTAVAAEGLDTAARLAGLVAAIEQQAPIGQFGSGSLIGTGYRHTLAELETVAMIVGVKAV